MCTTSVSTYGAFGKNTSHANAIATKRADTRLRRYQHICRSRAQ